jgi:hypothetical protein
VWDSFGGGGRVDAKDVKQAGVRELRNGLPVNKGRQGSGGRKVGE